MGGKKGRKAMPRCDKGRIKGRVKERSAAGEKDQEQDTMIDNKDSMFGRDELREGKNVRRLRKHDCLSKQSCTRVGWRRKRADWEEKRHRKWYGPMEGGGSLSGWLRDRKGSPRT